MTRATTPFYPARRRFRLGVAPLGVALLSVTLTGLAACGTTTSGTTSGGSGGPPGVTRQDCDAVSQVTSAPSAPVTVLVADDTASGPAEAGKLPSLVATWLQQAQGKHSELVILGVNGSGANPLPVKTVALDPRPGDKSRDADNARAIAISCVAGWIGAVSARPTRPGSDILGALDAAIRRAPASIIVMSDGLDNVDPLDLNTIGYAADPASVVAALQSTKSIGHATTATPLLWADLGVTVQPLPEVVRYSLTALWTAIARSAGLTVTFAPDATTAAAAPPHAPADPVKVPAVTTAVSGASGCRTTVTLPADLLFQPGDARISAPLTVLDSARAALSKPGASAVISGHTAAYGSASYRYHLSVARAKAVAAALEARGIPGSRLTIVGYGSTRPAENEFPGGRHDLAAAARNRRVVVDIKQGGCAG